MPIKIFSVLLSLNSMLCFCLTYILWKCLYNIPRDNMIFYNFSNGLKTLSRSVYFVALTNVLLAKNNTKIEIQWYITVIGNASIFLKYEIYPGLAGGFISYQQKQALANLYHFCTFKHAISSHTTYM